MTKNEIESIVNLFKELTYIDDPSGDLMALRYSLYGSMPQQTDKNGFFGQLQGAFNANTDLMVKIKEQCNAGENSQDNIYLSKIGINYFNYLDYFHNNKQNILKINQKIFQLGKNGKLELEDVYITSLQTLIDVNENFCIDYQYQRI